MRIIGNPNELPSGVEFEGTPLTRARYCAVTGATRDPEGFVDTGWVNPNTDEPVLISFGAIKELARVIGLPTRKELEALEQKINDEVDARDDQLAELREQIELEKARSLVTAADKE